MAEIYRVIPGIPSAGAYGAYEDPLNYVFSHHIETKMAIEAEMINRTARARAQMAMHHDEYHAVINAEIGAVDGIVWLEDRKEAKPVAHIIERGGEGGRGGARPLTAAFPEVML